MNGRHYFAYIGTNSVRGSKGIYTVKIDAETFVLHLVSTQQVFNSGSLALSRDETRLDAGIEGMTWNGLAEGAIVAYAVDENGRLWYLGGARSHGRRTCCVDVDEAGETAYACNFYQGTLSAFPLDASGAPQSAKWVVAPPPETTGRRALHCVRVCPGGRFAAVISLTECALIVDDAASGRRVADYHFP